MTIVWRALTGLLLVLVAGCGGSPEPDPKDPEGAVKIMFEEYLGGLADGDYERACAQMSPEYVGKQNNAMREAGVTNIPPDCAGAWEASVKAGVTNPKLLEDAAEDARLDRIYVNNDTARVDFTQTMDSGTTIPVIIDARPGEDGHWLLTNLEEQR